MKKFEGMILACDMDGTLLDSNHRISPKNQQALDYFVEEGGRFTLATGRTFRAIQQYIPQLPFNAPYSLLNGSLIRNESHQVLYCAGMPESTIDLIQLTLSEFSQLGCEIYSAEQVLVRQMSRLTKRHMELIDVEYSMVSQDDLDDPATWCKINFTGEPKRMLQVKKFLQPYADEFYMASSMPSFLEITAAGISKGTALQYIAKKCDIAENRIFAIGDSFNDQTMLETAYIGFAPANAEEEIRRIADVVVSSNDNDAVAEAIKYLEARL